MASLAQVLLNLNLSPDWVPFITNDLDFSALLAVTRGTGPSVLQIRLQDLLPDAAGATVLRVLQQHESMPDAGAIVTLTDNGTRVRVLPLNSEPA